MTKITSLKDNNVKTSFSNNEDVRSIETQRTNSEDEKENNFGIYSRNQTLKNVKQKISFGNGDRHINFLKKDTTKEYKKKNIYLNTFIGDSEYYSRLNTFSKKVNMTNIKEESKYIFYY